MAANVVFSNFLYMQLTLIQSHPMWSPELCQGHFLEQTTTKSPPQNKIIVLNLSLLLRI